MLQIECRAPAQRDPARGLQNQREIGLEKVYAILISVRLSPEIIATFFIRGLSLLTLAERACMTLTEPADFRVVHNNRLAQRQGDVRSANMEMEHLFSEAGPEHKFGRSAVRRWLLRSSAQLDYAARDSAPGSPGETVGEGAAAGQIDSPQSRNRDGAA